MKLLSTLINRASGIGLVIKNLECMMQEKNRKMRIITVLVVLFAAAASHVVSAQRSFSKQPPPQHSSSLSLDSWWRSFSKSFAVEQGPFVSRQELESSNQRRRALRFNGHQVWNVSSSESKKQAYLQAYFTDLQEVRRGRRRRREQEGGLGVGWVGISVLHASLFPSTHTDISHTLRYSAPFSVSLTPNLSTCGSTLKTTFSCALPHLPLPCSKPSLAVIRSSSMKLWCRMFKT